MKFVDDTHKTKSVPPYFSSKWYQTRVHNSAGPGHMLLKHTWEKNRGCAFGNALSRCDISRRLTKWNNQGPFGGLTISDFPSVDVLKFDQELV